MVRENESEVLSTKTILEFISAYEESFSYDFNTLNVNALLDFGEESIVNYDNEFSVNIYLSNKLL